MYMYDEKYLDKQTLDKLDIQYSFGHHTYYWSYTIGYIDTFLAGFSIPCDTVFNYHRKQLKYVNFTPFRSFAYAQNRHRLQYDETNGWND